MDPNVDSTLSGAGNTKKKTNAFSAPPKPNGKSPVSDATVTKPDGKLTASGKTPSSTASVLKRDVKSTVSGNSIATSVSALKQVRRSTASSHYPKKPTTAPTPSSAQVDEVMLFRDVSLGPHEASLRFRLIHFWEAWNPNTKTLIGQELLLIDEEGSVIQGFIPSGRVGTYELIAGSVYHLRNFFGSRNKVHFRVSDHTCTVSFTWNSVLTVLEDFPAPISADRFRFHTYEDFEANSDQKSDLYDFVGHMRLVNGETVTALTMLDEVEISRKRHILVHVQSYDGPIMKLYLWDQAATDFCQKFKGYDSTPSVLMVTTLNPKHLGGTLALGSMSSSRVFMDNNVEPTKEYLAWLSCNADVANKTEATVVTKPEIATIGELLCYMKQETSKVALFECLATIDDVFQGSAWYYISCDSCNSKAVKGPKSLICSSKKCDRTEIPGVPQYLTKISVYDSSEQAVFVLLGEAGRVLTGKHASELVANYFEANKEAGADASVPVPQALVDSIGQSRRFIVKVSEHNLTGKTQALTVTKILPLEAPPPSDESPVSGGEHSGPSAGDKIRKVSETLDSDEAKRLKIG